MISGSDSEDDIDLVALALRSMAASGVIRTEAEVQPELFIVANQQQPEQPQQGVGQVSLAAAASSWGSSGLSSFLQAKDELIVQLPLIIWRGLGQVHEWDSKLKCM